MALLGFISVILLGVLCILFRFITITIPPDWGCSLLDMWVKCRFGPKQAFRLFIWRLSECDSRMLRIVIFLAYMVCTIILHLSCVAWLFAPFTFRAAMVIKPASLGFIRALPHRCRGFLGAAVSLGYVGLGFLFFSWVVGFSFMSLLSFKVLCVFCVRLGFFRVLFLGGSRGGDQVPVVVPGCGQSLGLS